MYWVLLFLLCIRTCFSEENLITRIIGHVYGNTKNIGNKLSPVIRKTLDVNRTIISIPLHAVTDHNFRKQFARSKLARGSALSKHCNSRCSVRTPCNKRCQLARDRYQLALAKETYKKNHVKKYTSSQLNQRYYSGQVASGRCNSRCKAAKDQYEKQRTQYMKEFHVHCQNGHIKNTDTYHGKPLSEQGNPSGDTPGDKTTIGGYGGVAKGRPLGTPGAGQINWPNSAKYNWRTACKSYSSILGSIKPPVKGGGN